MTENQTPTINDFYTDPFPGKKGSERVREECTKCLGAGVINYGNVTLKRGKVEDRWCFQCAGRGYTTRLVSSARATARAHAKAEAARVLAERAAVEARAAFARDDAELLATMRELAPHSEFIADLLGRVTEGSGTLTENQRTALGHTFEKVRAQLAEEAAKVAAPEGKHTVTGTVVHTKWQESDFGYHTTYTAKMLVELDGWKAWATVPAKVLDEVQLDDLKGRTITFTATFEHSRDDASFAIAKRPTKIVLGAEA